MLVDRWKIFCLSVDIGKQSGNISTRRVLCSDGNEIYMLYLLLRLALHRCRCEYLSRLYKLQYRLDLSWSEHISLIERYSTSVSVTNGHWWHGPLIKNTTTVYERKIGFDEWVAIKSEVKQKLEC